LHALGHLLAGGHEIGSRFEDHRDRRVLGNRLGAQDIHPWHTVERLLHGDGDQGFDVGGGETDRGGVHLHLRRRELREDVHRHGAE
jgi:hypothetical protein